MAAKILTSHGISCLMLNAGPEADMQRDRTQKAVYDLPYRGFGKPGRLTHVFQANEFNANQWVDEAEVPYTYDPQSPYNWVRVRLLGGRSLFWSRQSFRLSDFEFNAAEIDGSGTSWPIRLADLAPFYSRVEEIFRVSGRKEGWPQFPDGNFVEARYPADSQTLKKVTDLCNARGFGVSKMRTSQGVGGLASSINLLLPDALATGKLEIVENAIVREISVDKNSGLVNGAHFVDRHSKREMFVKAKRVVLAAGALESTRLLLNSGIANSSGVMGHYLHDQIYVKDIVEAVVPEARDGKARRGLMGGGGYIPRFRNLEAREKDKRFIRGYSVDFGSGGAPNAKYYPAYGEELRKLMARDSGAGFHMTAMGEVLARKENHVRINKEVKDAWGIPALHIEHKYTDNEFEMARDAMNTLDEVCRAAGFEVIAKHPNMVPPGESIHEIGTCRMGSDPKTSVLNQWNQSHDIKNLFVVDGSSFVTCGWQNPTMTISALSMRASEYLAGEMKKGNIG